MAAPMTVRHAMITLEPPAPTVAPEPGPFSDDVVARRIGATEEDRYFSIRPFYHVAGTTLSLLVALCSGCSLLTLPSFDVAQALDMLEQERCTLTSGNDTIFLMLMGHAEFRRERLHLRGGWAAAGPETMQRIRDEMGVPYLCNA